MAGFYSTKRGGFASLSPKGMQEGGPVYEESPADVAEDKRGAKKLGVSLDKYEQTAKDKAEDKRGQAKLKSK